MYFTNTVLSVLIFNSYDACVPLHKEVEVKEPNMGSIFINNSRVSLSWYQIFLATLLTNEHYTNTY